MPDSPRSSRSVESLLSDGPRSPIDGFDSSAALIIVPEAEETASRSPFDFTSDDETEDELNEGAERVLSSAVPPLSSLTVFLYLLTPYLKLGAFLLPDCGLSLRYTLPALLFFAGLSAFARQIWYMLARYVRRADMEDILLETFAQDRRKERRRLLLRHSVRFCTGLMRVLLAALYLRASVDALSWLLPPGLIMSTRAIAMSLLAVLVCPITFATTLESARVIYATWASVGAYIAWFVCTVYLHSQGVLPVNPPGKPLGSLWRPVATVAFTFSTTWTVPLYASLRGTVQAVGDFQKRSQSFKLLSLLSLGTAIALIFPLVFSQTFPTSPAATPSLIIVTEMLKAAALALAIPSLIITCPALPIPLSIRRVTNFPISKSLLYVVVLCLSALPSPLSNILNDATLVLAFLGTYMLPAFIHIILHNLRRPLSIIIPPSTPLTTSASSLLSPESNLPESDSRHDELLLRKERSLQRRRLGRRIIWDIGVWVLLVPIGGGGFVWAGGRIVGKW